MPCSLSVRAARQSFGGGRANPSVWGRRRRPGPEDEELLERLEDGMP